LNHATFSQLPAADHPQAGIARLIRQVCLLREHGDAEQAGQLRSGPLANAVRDYRLTHGPDALPENELQMMFATEERRVTEAAILSELLVPRLVASLPALREPVRPATVRPGLEHGTVAASSSALPIGPPSISDLLDAMLAAERNAGRTSSAGSRESRTPTIRT
jgi:hypothetical protein